MTVARSRLLSPYIFTPFSMLLIEGMFEDDEQLLPWHETPPFCEPSTVVVSLGVDGKTLTWPPDWFCDTSPLEMTESPKVCGWGTARTEEPIRARSRYWARITRYRCNGSDVMSLGHVPRVFEVQLLAKLQ